MFSMDVPIWNVVLGCLMFGIAFIEACCAVHGRRQAATSPGVAWRRHAVFVLVWVNLGIVMLIPSDPITQGVRLMVIVVLLIGAWYGDRRARRTYESTEHTA